MIGVLTRTGPFELAKNVVQTSVLMSHRAMASSNAHADPELRRQPRLNTVDAFKEIVKRHGFRGLYAAFHLHAMRDTIGTGIYFSIYELVKQATARQFGQNASTFGGPMLAGAICSTTPWLIVCPTSEYELFFFFG